MLGPALTETFKKLDVRAMAKNPVMFVTMVGATITTTAIITSFGDRAFVAQLAVWLWFTVLFANFAEAVAEGRGKAQAASLRKARKETMARRLRSRNEKRVPATELETGDLVVCETGDTIPADGEVIEGIASVNEAAITGESAPVIRESGGDRSAVTGGTTVISDRIVVRVTAERGHGFLDRMIAMVEGAKRQKTPNEIALTILLSSLTLIFLLVCVTLQPFGAYTGATFPIPVLIALLVCLIPTTIGARSKPPVMLICCCSTRRERSRSATAWPRTLSPRQKARSSVSPTLHSSPPWQTRRRRAAASSSWPRKGSNSAPVKSHTRMRRSFHSVPRRA
jgi:K+-transporting ATPase ATPase B chain